MSVASWKKVLRPGQRGIAVEGVTDIDVFKAFLKAGEKQGLWLGSDSRLYFEPIKKNSEVVREVENAQNAGLNVWGIVDRDWRSESKIADLERQPGLLVLPRVMVENYMIDPKEVFDLLPKNRQTEEVRAELEMKLSDQAVKTWLQNGALWSLMTENNAFNFCRGKGRGYPSGILQRPQGDNTIQAQLNTWYNQLEPTQNMELYRKKAGEFHSMSTKTALHHGIYGKYYFRQVVVPALNQIFGQKSSKEWFNEFFKERTPPTCPVDLQPLLRDLMTF